MVHIEPCKVQCSDKHNDRRKDLPYVRKDLSPTNAKISFDNRSLVKIESDIRRLVKEKTGRAMQQRAAPIREGVVLTNEHTTLRQLSDFCAEAEQKWGIRPLRIYIHNDEGHRDVETGEWKPNRHAHIVWQWMDMEKGKSLKLGKDAMSDLQDLAAKHLKMKRGRKGSAAERLDAINFKIEKQAVNCEKLEEIAQNKARSRWERLMGKKVDTDAILKTAQNKADSVLSERTELLAKRESAIAEREKAFAGNYEKFVNQLNSFYEEMGAFKKERADFETERDKWRVMVKGPWQCEKDREIEQLCAKVKKLSRYESVLNLVASGVFRVDDFPSFVKLLQNGEWAEFHGYKGLEFSKTCGTLPKVQVRYDGSVQFLDQHVVSEQGFEVGLAKGMTDAAVLSEPGGSLRR